MSHDVLDPPLVVPLDHLLGPVETQRKPDTLPPSTRGTVPVVEPAAGEEAREAMACATSSAVTRRTRGWRARRARALGVVGALQQTCHPWGVGGSGGDGVDADAVGGVVGRHGERVHGALAGAVEGASAYTDVGDGRAGVDDRRVR